MWVLEYLEDVISDLKVFHGIDDPNEELTAARFFSLAWRLYAYKGAVRLRVEEEANTERVAEKPVATAQTLQNHPDFQAKPGFGEVGMFEVTQL
jgi:hypothetical protein